MEKYKSEPQNSAQTVLRDTVGCSMVLQAHAEASIRDTSQVIKRPLCIIVTVAKTVSHRRNRDIMVTMYI